MDKNFIKKLHQKHIETVDNYPPTSSISKFTTKVILTLFPEQSKQHHFLKLEECERALYTLQIPVQKIVLSPQISPQ